MKTIKQPYITLLLMTGIVLSVTINKTMAQTTVRANMLPPIGYYLDNRIGRGFDIQYERPIHSPTVIKFLKGRPNGARVFHYSLNVRAFHSLRNLRSRSTTYEKTGGTVMIKKYKTEHRDGRFFGVAFTLANAVFTENIGFANKSKGNSKRGFYTGFGLVWGKTFRAGNWSIEPVLQLGVGLDNIKTTTYYHDPDAYLDLFPEVSSSYELETFLSNSHFALNIGYDI